MPADADRCPGKTATATHWWYSSTWVGPMGNPYAGIRVEVWLPHGMRPAR